ARPGADRARGAPQCRPPRTRVAGGHQDQLPRHAAVAGRSRQWRRVPQRQGRRLPRPAGDAVVDPRTPGRARRLPPRLDEGGPGRGDHGHDSGRRPRPVRFRSEDASMTMTMSSIRPKVRVVIVDDHTLFREGLRTILEMEENIEVVADAESAEDIVELTWQTRPDVLLLDIRMPQGSGLDAVPAVRRSRPRPPGARLTA